MLTTFVASLWATAADLAPSLFVGLAVAGILHVLVKRESIFRHIGRPGFASTLKAAVFGVPLPLCSCGVLPAALALRKDGASRGATVSFLASTPQTGVDSIAATWGMLGWPVALAKMLAALVAGVVSGTLVDRSEPDVIGGVSTTSCESPEKGSVVFRAWNYSFNTILGDIWAWLLLGVAVSAVIFTVVSPGQLAEYPALGGFSGLLAALLFGLPLYVCSVASVPIAAAMIHAGFPPGAALVFLMAGPATNAATMGAIRKALGKQAFSAYLVTIVVVSLGAGLLLDNITIPAGGTAGTSFEEGVSLWKSIAAGLFFAALAVHALRGLKRVVNGMVNSSEQGSVVLDVSGMTCGKCVSHVKKALEGLAGVRSVTVTLLPGSAVIEPDEGFNPCAAVAAVNESGYEARLRGGSCGCTS